LTLSLLPAVLRPECHAERCLARCSVILRGRMRPARKPGTAPLVGRLADPRADGPARCRAALVAGEDV
jgi:hypothetical protein